MFNLYTLKLYDINHRLIDFTSFTTKLTIITNLESLDNFAKQTLLLLNTLKEYDLSSKLEVLVFPIQDFLPKHLLENDVRKFVRQFGNLKVFRMQKYKCEMFRYLNSSFSNWSGVQQRQNLVKYVVKDNVVLQVYEPNENPSIDDEVIRCVL